MMRALIKRLAYYSPIDNSTIVSFVYFRVDPEPRTTLHVKICELRQREVRRFSLPRIPVHKAYGEKGSALLEAPPLPARSPLWAFKSQPLPSRVRGQTFEYPVVEPRLFDPLVWFPCGGQPYGYLLALGRDHICSVGE